MDTSYFFYKFFLWGDKNFADFFFLKGFFYGKKGRATKFIMHIKNIRRKTSSTHFRKNKDVLETIRISSF